jgi:hypothetical protein
MTANETALHRRIAYDFHNETRRCLRCADGLLDTAQLRADDVVAPPSPCLFCSRSLG